MVQIVASADDVLRAVARVESQIVQLSLDGRGAVKRLRLIHHAATIVAMRDDGSRSVILEEPDMALLYPALVEARVDL